MGRRAWRRAALLGMACALTLGAAQLTALAAADDRAVTEALVAELGRDTAHAAHTADGVRRARENLERATRMRQAGDDKHARVVEATAREWAESAREVARSADLEVRAADTRRAAMDAGAQVERERALLEEGIARNGRLRAQLEAATRESKEEPARTARTALDAGAARGGARPPAAGLDGGLPRPGSDAGAARSTRDAGLGSAP